MYTPMQVSEMLKLAPSTLRRYSSLFASYLSPQSPGKKRSYTDSDIVTLQKIKELSRKWPLSEIGPRLPVVEETPPAPDNSLMLVPEIARQLERLDSARQAVLTELEELKTAWKNDHDRLERWQAWAALPWWKRIFTSPPDK